MPVFVDDQREQLLELVDDEDELGAVAGQDAFDGPAESAVVTFQLLHQARGRIYRDAEQRRFELLERILAGRHLDDRPRLGGRKRTTPESREEPGDND